MRNLFCVPSIKILLSLTVALSLRLADKSERQQLHFATEYVCSLKNKQRLTIPQFRYKINNYLFSQVMAQAMRPKFLKGAVSTIIQQTRNETFHSCADMQRSPKPFFEILPQSEQRCTSSVRVTNSISPFCSVRFIFTRVSCAELKSSVAENEKCLRELEQDVSQSRMQSDASRCCA